MSCTTPMENRFYRLNWKLDIKGLIADNIFAPLMPIRQSIAGFHPRDQ